MMGKTIYINLGNDCADIYIVGEGRSKRYRYFRLRDHEEVSGWYVVEEHYYNDGEDRIIRVCSGPYRELDVSNMRDLLSSMIINPKGILTDLLGLKLRIKKVVVR